MYKRKTSVSVRHIYTKNNYTVTCKWATHRQNYVF